MSEPNEVGLAVVQVREKVENARPSLWRPGRELTPYKVKLKCGPKLEATTSEVAPVYGGAVFVGDATSLRKPKQGHAKGTPLEITVERQGRGRRRFHQCGRDLLIYLKNEEDPDLGLPSTTEAAGRPRKTERRPPKNGSSAARRALRRGARGGSRGLGVLQRVADGSIREVGTGPGS